MAKTSDLVLEVIAFISDLQQTCFNIDFTSAKQERVDNKIKSLPSKGNLICKNCTHLEAMDSILLPLGFIKVAVLGKALLVCCRVEIQPPI